MGLLSSEARIKMPVDLSTNVKIIGVVVIAVIIFIGAMVGTSLRKLSTEEGNSICFSIGKLSTNLL